MKKITMSNPIVEIDGDEMTRIMWDEIKIRLLSPYIELKTLYYDLGLPNRELTKDSVTNEAAEAIKKYGVGVKCATITPNADRVKEYSLTKMWKSPNATIRAMLDGTVFRNPIIVDGIQPVIPHWTKPIIIARHAYGDVYSGVESHINESGVAKLVLPGEATLSVHVFTSPGIVQAIHNTDESIRSFARSCFNYALEVKLDLWFSAKDTISKVYDHRFKDIFYEVYKDEFEEKFAKIKINYFYTLIDDAVARLVRSQGGFVWACKNYDGDVMSDMLASVFGSLAMMTSVLVSPDGKYEYEAAHGTVTRHYYQHVEGKSTSTNPVATIFAWTGALRKRGELDGEKDLIRFSNLLEEATLAVISSGFMTKDLLNLFKKEGIKPKGLTTNEFLDMINLKLYELIQSNFS